MSQTFGKMVEDQLLDSYKGFPFLLEVTNEYVGRTAWSPSSQASVLALNPSPQTVDPDRDRSGLNLNCSSSFSN